jgi:hypothetical protein
MTGLSALWLPMLVSAVLVFVASSIIHMASPCVDDDDQGDRRRIHLRAPDGRRLRLGLAAIRERIRR